MPQDSDGVDFEILDPILDKAHATISIIHFRTKLI